jgi:hypothetical protein
LTSLGKINFSKGLLSLEIVYLAGWLAVCLVGWLVGWLAIYLVSSVSKSLS